MKKVGFEYQETMSGTYTLSGETDPPKRFAYSAKLVAENAIDWAKTRTMRIEGTIDMEDFADDVPIHGSLEFHPLTQKSVKYKFAFCGNDGEPYVFEGQKDLRLGDIVHSLTTLLGTVTDINGAEVGRIKAVFDLKADLLPFLISWKPVGLAPA